LEFDVSVTRRKANAERDWICLADFTLPLHCAPLQNTLLRMHWSKRRKIKQEAMTRMLASGGRRKSPVDGRPMVRVIRRSTQRPDGDSGYGAKLPLDCLKDLGWIRDDSDDAIDLTFSWKAAKRGEGRLVVEVWSEVP